MLATVPSRKFYPPLGNCPLQNYISKLLFYLPYMFYNFWSNLLTNSEDAKASGQTPAEILRIYDKESTFIYDDRKYFEQSRQQSEEVFRQATAALCGTDGNLVREPNTLRGDQSRCLIPKKSYSERIVTAIGDLAVECKCLMKSYVKAIKRIEGIKQLEQTWSNKEQQQQLVSRPRAAYNLADKPRAAPKHDSVSTMTFTIDGKCLQGATRNGDCLYELQMSGAGRKVYKKDEEQVSYFRTFYHESKSVLNRMSDNNGAVKNSPRLIKESPKPRKRRRPIALNTLREYQ